MLTEHPLPSKADQLGKTPMQVYESYQPPFSSNCLNVWVSVMTCLHQRIPGIILKLLKKVFVTLLENGYLHTEISKQWFSEKQQRFLPDRYVVGTCYLCGAERQRSDQCELCGQILDPEKLIDPISIIDRSTPVLKKPNIIISIYVHSNQKSAIFCLNVKTTGDRT